MIRARLTASCLIAAVAATTAASAQFRTSVDVVRLDALVTEHGRPVTGLTAGDFALDDNGERQALTVRPVASTDIDVLVVLDVSGSVKGARLEHLRAATSALIGGALTPRDRATLIAFNHVVALGPADAAPEALRARLAALRASGATSLVDATTLALAWAAGRDRPTLVLVFSDGRDTASWTRGDQALALARRSNAVVDAVVTGDLLARASKGGPSYRIVRGRPVVADVPPPDLTERLRLPSDRFLVELTTLVGGRLLNADAGGGLSSAFASALAEFRTRYEITYTPTSADPGWHRIDLRVTSRRGVAVQARPGYQR